MMQTPQSCLELWTSLHESTQITELSLDDSGRCFNMSDSLEPRKLKKFLGTQVGTKWADPHEYFNSAVNACWRANKPAQIEKMWKHQ